MNLLFFGSDYNAGLTTALTEQILEIATQPEIRLSCVSSQNEMEYGLHDIIKNNNISIDIIHNLDDHRNFRILAHQIKAIIARDSITHVNVHNNWQMALVTYIKYKKIIPLKFKIIYTIHGYRHNSSLKSIFAIGIIGFSLFLFANRVISMSSYVSKRFWFIAYKTDLVFYTMNKPEYKLESYELKGAPISMVFPAQFREGKNQAILIEALDLYIKKTGDTTIRLHLPGSGSLEMNCQKIVHDKGLTDQIIFPGKLSHAKVMELYKKTNVALISSNVETYGRCIAEPFILGRCIITQKTGVALDIIKDAQNGFFFSNASDLASLLEKLHKHPELLIKAAKSAYEDRNIFSSESVMNSYLISLENA